MLKDRMDGPDFGITVTRVRVRPLDSLAVDPDYLKLDVQGAEYDALVGLTDTLARSSPIMLIETPDHRVRAFLESRGYAAWSYSAERRALIPERDNASNTVFVPRSEA